MRRLVLAALAVTGLGLLPAVLAAETWKDVPVVDTQCINKVKANPDAHTRKCALQCQKAGYGLIAPDGAYLKFDATGNEKALAALKASKKDDHLRATVTGDRDGDIIKVKDFKLE